MMSLLYDALNRGVKVIFVVPGKGGIYFLINYARGSIHLQYPLE